jgi:hypothetical protein
MRARDIETRGQQRCFDVEDVDRRPLTRRPRRLEPSDAGGDPSERVSPLALRSTALVVTGAVRSAEALVRRVSCVLFDAG